MATWKLFNPRILRRVLKLTRNHYITVGSNKAVQFQNNIAKQLRTKIIATGPITVAEYMKEVLVNPLTGYYMNRDMIGQTGDFITSPELTQMFGELIAIWFLNEWSKAGSPKPVQIVELGPGRGTLCQDILRVFSHFRLLEHATVHLVEVSPHLSNLQANRLCFPSEINLGNVESAKEPVKEGKGVDGVPISWHKHFDDVPDGFTFLVAHEFFDALPIHKFQKTDQGYREILVDIDQNVDTAFRYVLSNSETPTGKLFLKSDEQRLHLEISPESLILIKKITSKLKSHGGFALIADYGHDGTGTDTFRAFKNHKLHDPLIEPGTADLTADVDFSALKQVATENKEVLAFGPISQSTFLHKMGIEYRLEVLKKNAKDNQLKSLEYSYKMLTDVDKMGERFKFFALLPATLEKILKKYPVTAFD